jgi:hypothetical protein
MRYFVAVFLPLIATPLVAQVPPPNVLDIVRERLRPNSESAYDSNERQIARVCATMKCPIAYVALESVNGPKEIWWFNPYDSEAQKDSLKRAFEADKPLMAELRTFGQRKERFRHRPVTIGTTLRRDLSDESCWKLGSARFVVIATAGAQRRSRSCIFQSVDERRFSITFVASESDARRSAKLSGADARIFAIRPEWSHTPEVRRSESR